MSRTAKLRIDTMEHHLQLNKEDQCFSGKRIVLGISGGIAAYKAAEIVRHLVKKGSDVQVIMTRSAKKLNWK